MKIKKKILIISDEIFPIGWGIGKYNLILKSALENNFDVSILGPYTHKSKKIIRVSKNSGFNGFFGVIKLIRILVYLIFYSKTYDKIISTHPSTTKIIFYLKKYFSLTISNLFIVYHGSEIIKLKKLNNYENIFSQSNHIVISSMVNKHFIDSFKQLSSKVIHNCINEVEKHEFDTENRYNTFLLVGRIDWRKGYSFLIPYLKSNLNKFNSKITVVGTGGNHESTIIKKIRNNNLDNFFDFKGSLSDLELNKEYISHKFFLLAATNENGRIEGFGLSVLEAMSMGCIPIVSNVGGQVDLVGKDYPFIFNLTFEDFNKVLAKTSDKKSVNKAKKILEERRLLFSKQIFSKNWYNYLS